MLASLFTLSCGNTSKPLPPGNAITLTGNKPTVIYFLNADCPICNKYQGTFRLIERQNPRTRFYYVFCGDIKPGHIEEFVAYDSLDSANVIRDPQMQTARAFGATVTPMAMVFDGKGFCYTGKIDDRFADVASSKPEAAVNYVNNALFSLSRHEPVEISHTEPVGCFIERPD